MSSQIEVKPGVFINIKDCKETDIFEYTIVGTRKEALMPTSSIKRVKRNISDAFAIVELATDIGTEIIGLIAKYGFEKVEQMKIGDLPFWKAWKYQVLRPRMKKLIGEYRRLKK